MSRTIYVLGGGNSLERDVSLRSSAAVKKALEEAGYETKYVDPKDDANWASSIPEGSIVFPILHGNEGEDGVVQQIMTDHKLAFLGSTPEASALCFDKARSRAIYAENNIPTAQGDIVTATEYATHPLAQKPHVLKISRGGSSIGTMLVHDPVSQVAKAQEEVFKLGDEAVIEELISGIEITVPVLDGKALPVIEIIPPTDGEFDYENKYNGKTQEICPAETITPEQQAAAGVLAEKAHAVTGARHLSRTDMFVRPDGSIVVLETNTMPGMTDQSLYPKSAKVSGLPMPELMKKFVEFVERDYRDLLA